MVSSRVRGRLKNYLPIPLVGPLPLPPGEPLEPLLRSPTPGEVGFEEAPDAGEALPEVLAAPDEALEPTDGQSTPGVRLTGLPEREPLFPALGLPAAPVAPFPRAGGQSTALPDADVPGVWVPPVDPGAADDGLPRPDVPVEPLVAALEEVFGAAGLPASVRELPLCAPLEDWADAMPAAAASTNASVADGSVFISVL
jgi:hypothetical protein